MKCKRCGSTMKRHDSESWICPECRLGAFKLNGSIYFNEEDYMYDSVYDVGDLDDGTDIEED